MTKKKISTRQQAPKVTRKDSPTAATARKVTRPKTAYELLARVCDGIVREPLAYFQDWWRVRPTDSRWPSALTERGACGTAFCRAGWIVSLHDGKTKVGTEVGDRAMAILGFDPASMARQAAWMELFPVGIVKGTPGTVSYAKAGAAGLRAFMKKHAAHLKARKLSDVPKLGKG